MSFLSDYLLYNEGNECHKNYHIWCGLFLLSAALGRRVYIKQGYFDIHPNLYICLVGKQGNRKTTAKDIARDIFVEALPDIPLGAAMQSREDIIKYLASDDALRYYTDEHNNPIEVRPIVFFINELKNFLSFNPGGMIEFLTDIYDRKMFDASTIKRNLEVIINPCVNFLACETPAWIVDKLKLNIISGGFARRVVYVYEIEEGSRIPFPTPTAEGLAARQRCVDHLRKVTSLAGEFQWTDESRDFYSKWYIEMASPADETMAGYYRSKHVQLLKIVMALAAGEPNPVLLITKSHLVTGISILDIVEKHMPKLSVAAGRNELAIPTQRILEILESNGGYMREKQLRIAIGKDLNPAEQLSVLNYLQRDTEQTVKLTMVRGGTAFPEVWLIDAFRRAVQAKYCTKHETQAGAFVWNNGA